MDMELRMDTGKLPRSRRPRSLLLAIVAAVALTVGVAPALAASDIEGVWSFGGGQIAIQPLSNGTFAGTVVAETKFAECSHPVGQQIWAGMTLQTDGSYWGLHQWYFESTCALNPELGRTAWRVLQATDGSHYLRVCFSSPGTSQPTIAPNGAPAGPSEYAAYHVTYGCDNSALIAPLPSSGGSSSGESGLSKAVVLPTTNACVKLNSLKIKLRDPKYDPLKEVIVRIKGKKIAVVRGTKKLKKGISLTGLPSGAYTLKVVARTVLGHTLQGSRTYHSCSKQSSSSGSIKLHSRKHH
jgi:hypothetical protein